MRHFLQRMRAEARENLRLVRPVQEHGRYWKLPDPTPQTKEWKTNSVLIEGDESLEGVYEAGLRAAAEVDRILTTRSFRMFRGGRVKSDDRLSEVTDALTHFDQVLTDAMETRPEVAVVSG
jgi:hypothetical protein